MSKKKNYTHIHVVLDRTGSMETIRNDTIGGFNSFLQEQQELPGKATMSLVQFDSQDPYEVVLDFENISKAKKLTRETYVPRAATPLLDAIGRSINDVEEKISAMKKKPDGIIIAVITDGQENSSQEFNLDQIKKMIEDKQNEKWQFAFLSADLASIKDAIDMGIPLASTMSYGTTPDGVHTMYSSVSQSVSNYRKGKSDGVTFEEE